MTIPSFMGLQTSLRGLLADQAAIDTTGHNIANANTPGYSRQQAVLTESDALTIPAFSNVTGAGVQVGTGVDATSINRIRDQFLDIQYRAQNTNTSGSNQTATILQQVQTGLAEPSKNGLSTQLSAFWQAWSDLANNPSSPAARQTVLNAGTTLAQTFNLIDQQLTTVETQVDQQFQALTASPSGKVATDASQLAALNGEISQAVQAGQQPNDLMDQRDKLLDDLSSLAKVSVTNMSNGMVSVTFGDAKNPLVNGLTVNWPQTLTSAAGGQLGALKALYDSSTNTGSLENYRSGLDTVATDLITTVNNAYNPSANPAVPNFFTDTPPSIAGTIAVNPAVTAANLQTTTTTSAGANDVALAVAALQGGQADQAYASYVAGVGSDVQSTQATQQTSQAVLSSIDNQRQSVSGVSLDEEMTNLITFQRGYQASSRMMTTIDGMLDTLINHTGTVGL